MNLNPVEFALLAFSSALATQELAIGVAAVVLLIGTRLCWTAPRYRMSMEERMKDERITEESARRKIQVMHVAGPSVIVIGVALMACALLA